MEPILIFPWLLVRESKPFRLTEERLAELVLVKFLTEVPRERVLVRLGPPLKDKVRPGIDLLGLLERVRGLPKKLSRALV